MSRTLVVLLAIVTALAVTACSRQEPEISPQEQVPAAARTQEPGADGENGGDAPAGEPYEFVAEDLAFPEHPTEVAAGTVTFELVNEGNLPHDVSIEELGDREVVAADGGQTATGNVELEPGEYTFYCSVPGHRQAGMEGTITVE